jgi:hypothetical protein
MIFQAETKTAIRPSSRLGTTPARTVAGTFQSIFTPAESFSAGHCPIQSLLWRDCHGSGVSSRKGFLFMEQHEEDALDQFDDHECFDHLYVSSKGYNAGPRRVKTLQVGFIDDGSGCPYSRDWYVAAGLVMTHSPCLVIPIDGLNKMSDADLLAAIKAGSREARITELEADILGIDRMPYAWESENLTLEQFRCRYYNRYHLLDVYTHRSEIISGEYDKIKPVWEGRNEEAGFIYCLHDQQGHYKIGLTKNLTQRIKQLSTQPPFKLTLICAFRVVNASKYESILHLKYDAQRLNGEWFELSAEDVATLIREHAGKDFITEKDLEAIQNPNGQRLLPGSTYDY